MIHELRISNFFCIRDEQSIDLRVSGKVMDDPRFVSTHSDPSVRVPTVIAMFGPNGSGKSTVLRAIRSLVDFATLSFDLNVTEPMPYFTPHLSEGGLAEHTRLEAIFDAFWLSDDRPATFHYIVEVKNDNASAVEVVREDLYYTLPGSRRRRYFERAGGRVFAGEPMRITSGDSRLKSVRANCSVIATLAKFGHEPMVKIWRDLSNVQSNFSGLQKFRADSGTLLRWYANNPLFLEALNRELRRIDIGLERLDLHHGPSGPVAFFTHEGLKLPVPFHGESQGTQHFLAIFPQLFYVLREGHVALIDELDSDLHPLLVPEIFRWFQDPERNPNGAQLWVTAHNAALLEVLEKEEVFLTEKRHGQSTVVAVQDIQGLRRSPSLMKKYLGGELGAVPRIG